MPTSCYLSQHTDLDWVFMELGFEYLAATSVIAGLIVLIVLSIIDLRVWLLPNKWVLTFAILGVLFQTSLMFAYPRAALTLIEMGIGALLGGGILYVIRICGNAYYKQDTLGLGDVKLLLAAGLWLGPEGVVFALTGGAFAGLVHGIVVAEVKAIREKSGINLKRLMIPAGPGFCIGIVGAWLYLFYGYWEF